MKLTFVMILLYSAPNEFRDPNPFHLVFAISTKHPYVILRATIFLFLTTAIGYLGVMFLYQSVKIGSG